MGQKFHYNPHTGHVGLCKAQQACPWGEEVHFFTARDARQAFEEKARKAHAALPKVRKLPDEEGPHLSTLLDTKQLVALQKEGFIQVAKHPQDLSLQVLTYSTLAQISGKWNQVTKQTRGLIIRSEKPDYSDAVVVERPWRKFFTLGQIQNADGSAGWALGDEEEGASSSAGNELANLDFHAPAEVTDKCDGSLGVLYRAPDGKLAFATKGSFASEQATYYTNLLRRDKERYAAAEELKRKHPATTFLMELTGPDNQIVLEYDHDDIILLGAVDKHTGLYHSTSDYDEEWASKGFSKAEAMPATSITEALALPERPKREGMVVRLLADDADKQMMIKIKQEDYLRLHRLSTGFSKTAARSLVRDSKASMSDLVKAGEEGDFNAVPELGEALQTLREGRSTFHKKLYEKHASHLETTVTPKLRTAAEAYHEVQALPETEVQGGTASKLFAERVAKEPPFRRAMLFAFFNARREGIPVEEMKTGSLLRTLSKSI